MVSELHVRSELLGVFERTLGEVLLPRMPVQRVAIPEFPVIYISIEIFIAFLDAVGVVSRHVGGA